MKKLLFLVFLYTCLIISPPVKAQYYYYNDKYYNSDLAFELGVSAGIMNSLTDLGGKKGVGKGFIKDLNWKNTRPSFSIYGLVMYKSAIAVRLEGTFGSIQGYDSILKPVASSTFGRYERNLSFKSKITDIQLAVEIHPLFFKYYDEDEPRFSPYAVIGAGYYSFDPKGYLNGNWYSLQPLHTEGQGFPGYRNRIPYKLNQLNIAVGLGVKYEVNSFLNARLEIVHRILSTDYLDDVSTTYVDPSLFAANLPANLAAVAQQLSDRQGELDPTHTTIPGAQRGDPSHKDAFFSIQLKIGMAIGRQRR
jgi:hypothetical protein